MSHSTPPSFDAFTQARTLERLRAKQPPPPHSDACECPCHCAGDLHSGAPCPGCLRCDLCGPIATAKVEEHLTHCPGPIG